MFLNLFLLLVAYYVLRTIREPLILASGAEVKSYASAGQALVLVGFVPLYGWFASKVDRMKLIVGFILFFIVNIELFSLGGLAGVPRLGVMFYIWVGIFSLATIAQFWSYANDVYRREAGERLFAFIFLGASLGAPVGAKLAELLFKRGWAPTRSCTSAPPCSASTFSCTGSWTVGSPDGTHRRRLPRPSGPRPAASSWSLPAPTCAWSPCSS